MATAFRPTVQKNTNNIDQRLLSWFFYFLAHPYVHEERQCILGELKAISFIEFCKLEDCHRASWLAAFFYSLRPRYIDNTPIRDNVLDPVTISSDVNDNGPVKFFQYKPSSYVSTARGAFCGAVNRAMIKEMNVLKGDYRNGKIAEYPEWCRNPRTINLKSVRYVEAQQAIDCVYAHLSAVEKGIDISQRRSLNDVEPDDAIPIQFDDDNRTTKAKNILPFDDYIRLIQRSQQRYGHGRTPEDVIKHGIVEGGMTLGLRSGAEYRQVGRKHFYMQSDMGIRIYPPWNTKSNNSYSTSYVICYILMILMMKLLR